MRTIDPVAGSRRLRLDPSAVLRGVLIGVLVATYILGVFSLVVAIAVWPFGNPADMFVPPDWLLPLTGHADLLDAYLAIVFGPTFGVSLVAAAFTLFTMPRVYRWLRTSINDLLDEPQDEAAALVAKVHSDLAATTSPRALLPTVTATIAQALKLPYVAIATEESDAFPESAFGIPPPGAVIQHLPLRYRDIQIGELHVAARRPGEPLSPSDLKVLDDLAQQVGITLYAARMTADLQRSRARLVTAREEERRRIRRDLHDGLGPTLANFAMRLEQARDSLPPGAEESAALLTALTAEAQSTIQDVRRLVYQLRPPDLDEYGLVSALREYLHRITPKGTTITLHAPETTPALPAAVEVAAYRIVQEAVNNAVKHAHAAAITVTLALLIGENRSSALRVEVSDNGVGLPAGHPIGIGLHSMQERAEELGGTFLIRAGEEGGTFVVAQLPIA